MKYSNILLFLSFLLLSVMISCDSSTDSENDIEPETLEFVTESSDDLTQMIEDTPSDFTWEFFGKNILISLQSDNDWEGELVLAGFQVLNGEIVDRTSTDPFEANGQLLSNGVLTKEFQSVNFTITDWVERSKWKKMANSFKLKWKNKNVQGSLELWGPGNRYSPSEIEDAILAETDLQENESLFVVYTELASESPEREQTTQPFGLIMTEESSTGNLEVTTETGGSNPDDGYEVSVSDQTESIGANETITISNLTTGNHDSELTDVADNCSVINGDNPRTVTINADQTTSTTFEVNCAEALSGQLAFTSFRDGNANIHTITEDGSSISQLTSHEEFDGQTAISPNGTKIAFTSERDGNREIYVMNSDGSGLTRLTNNTERDELPAWSPDGSQLAFSSQRDGVDDIFIMDSDGSNVTKVTTDPEVDTHPTWSPDGTSIAFQTTRDGQWNIYKINTDGTEITQLTDNPDLWDRHPIWSPDGSQIAFSSDRNDNNEIFIMDSDGSNVTKITNSSSRDILPTWSPNGDFIGFQSNRAGGANIHIIGSDGSSPSRLTTSGAFDESPNWSPVE